jgi:CRISPR/Cas system CSM-associated protein Csm3 (group 7 of RAMP superfamily)
MKHFIQTRIVARANWVAETAMHTGGEELATGATSDMPVLRNADGYAFVSGASIAGAARSALGRWVHDRVVDTLFGGKKDDGFASLVETHDAFIEGTPTIRDGVRIDPKTGQTLDGAKFDMEVLPAGSSLPLCLKLNLYNEPPSGMTQTEMIDAFHILLNEFVAGRVRLGARTRRGFGLGSVKRWDIRELHSDNLEHVKAWLSRKLENGARVELQIEPSCPQIPGFQITAGLCLRTSLMIRSIGRRPGDPDFIHLRDVAGGPGILAGTGLCGILRHRCERIANTLGLANRAPLLESLFGRVRDSRNDLRKLRASRVWISECALEQATHLKQGRVRIDRFTGGASEGALFDEAPAFPHGDQIHARVDILIKDRPRECEVALLLLAFKDLWLGDLPVGGEAGIGRGVFDGVGAIISWNGSTVNIARTASGLTVTGEVGQLNDVVRDLAVNARAWRPFEWEERDDQD